VDLKYFCDKLISGAFEVLCDCVCVSALEWLQDKMEHCRTEIPVYLHFERLYDPRYWGRTMHEIERRGNLFQCSYPVSSSYVAFQV